jgi:hypothetical protein
MTAKSDSYHAEFANGVVDGRTDASEGRWESCHSHARGGRHRDSGTKSAEEQSDARREIGNAGS